MQFAYLRGVTQAQGQNYELLAITAAVLGGTSLFGGTGTIWGSDHRRVPARVDPDRAGADRRAGLVLRDLHRHHAGRRGHRQRPRSAASAGRSRMSAAPLQVEAPAPVPDRAEIDRSRRAGLRARAISHSYGRNKVIFDVEPVGLAGRGGGAGRRQRRRQVDAAQDLRRLPAADRGHAALHGQGRPLRLAGGCPRDRASRRSTRTSPSSTSSSLWRNFFLGKEIVKKRFGPLSVLDREADAPRDGAARSRSSA